ncbi:MAG: TIM barrel protein [Anaerolineae bacterium]|nr:TIM barrel protein [Anaerolineae bacterium]
MYKNLNAGAIGITGMALPETLSLAAATGFAGVDFSIDEVAALCDQHSLDYIRELFDGTGVRPGQWGLPVSWQDDERYPKDLARLPRLAELAARLGCLRTATWCPPASDERPFEENFAWHVARFRPIAEILDAYGCRLGIEFIGPQTLRTARRYEFIYTLEGMMTLAGAIGTGNVGLLLDAWHLYTAGGSVADLDRITAQDIVTVHVNDAPAGIPIDAQVDNVRCLPMETGVIDLPAFMRKLAGLGYDGPVTPEPFSRSLNALASQDPRAAAERTARHMDQMWAAAFNG